MAEEIKNTPEVKVRYSDEELQEFKAIIIEMLEKAKAEYKTLRDIVTHSSSNDIEDTSPTFKVMEEGAMTLSKEEAGALAQRQYKFIQNLEAALIRIENKTYGVCRMTGKLIPKERLRLVPHATLTVEAKEMMNKNK
jgi:RNA polymerase-binding transcription factor DksA